MLPSRNFGAHSNIGTSGAIRLNPAKPAWCACSTAGEPRPLPRLRCSQMSCRCQIALFFLTAGSAMPRGTMDAGQQQRRFARPLVLVLKPARSGRWSRSSRRRSRHRPPQLTRKPGSIQSGSPSPSTRRRSAHHDEGRGRQRQVCRDEITGESVAILKSSAIRYSGFCGRRRQGCAGSSGRLVSHRVAGRAGQPGASGAGCPCAQHLCRQHAADRNGKTPRWNGGGGIASRWRRKSRFRH